MGQLPQNKSENRDTSVIFRASHFADEFMSRDMVLQSVFQFGFLPLNPCLFSLKSSLEFILHHGKPKFTSLPVSPQQTKVSFGLTCFHCKCLKGNQSVALRKMGCLFNSAKMMLSVLHKELECKVEKLGGHAAKDQKYI